jgi:hypothetical protein
MIREVFPNARCSPPASAAAITEAGVALKLEIPDVLRQLYHECNGFREDRGNAEYLLPLSDLVELSTMLWLEFDQPDLKPFLFYGSTSGGKMWGVNWGRPGEIIAFHHNMEGRYEIAGADILSIWAQDYKRYEQFCIPPQVSATGGGSALGARTRGKRIQAFSCRNAQRVER